MLVSRSESVLSFSIVAGSSLANASSVGREDGELSAVERVHQVDVRVELARQRLGQRLEHRVVRRGDRHRVLGHPATEPGPWAPARRTPRSPNPPGWPPGPPPLSSSTLWPNSIRTSSMRSSRNSTTSCRWNTPTGPIPRVLRWWLPSKCCGEHFSLVLRLLGRGRETPAHWLDTRHSGRRRARMGAPAEASLLRHFRRHRSSAPLRAAQWDGEQPPARADPRQHRFDRHAGARRHRGQPGPLRSGWAGCRRRKS